MSIEPSVETKIREILTNPDTVGNLEITWGSVEDGDLDKAVQLISALFSTQQAQTREEVKGLKKAPCEFEEEMGYHTKDCCHGENTYNQAITDVLNILGEDK